MSLLPANFNDPVLVLDIGGTHLRIAKSPDGEKLEEIQKFDTPQNYSQALKLIGQSAKDILNGQRIKKAVVAVAMVMDHQGNPIRSAHIKDWLNKPLKSDLEVILDAPVYLENDAALAGLAESIRGNGKNFDIVAYLTISTGIGGVKIINQQIDRTDFGFEIGHQIIKPSGIPCPGKDGYGHLESYISGLSLKKKYNVPPEEIDNKKAWKETAFYLAIGLHNLIVHWSPEIVLIGGAVGLRIPLDILRAKLKKSLTIYPKLPKIEYSKLADNAGLYGALEFSKIS